MIQNWYVCHKYMCVLLPSYAQSKVAVLPHNTVDGHASTPKHQSKRDDFKKYVLLRFFFCLQSFSAFHQVASSARPKWHHAFTVGAIGRRQCNTRYSTIGIDFFRERKRDFSCGIKSNSGSFSDLFVCIVQISSLHFQFSFMILIPEYVMV